MSVNPYVLIGVPRRLPEPLPRHVEGFSRPQHPSGRPIRRERTVGRRRWNIPDDEPQTPRLQKKQGKDAMGFVHDFPVDDFTYGQET